MSSSRWIVAAVLIILLLGGGYFIYNKSLSKPDNSILPTDLLAGPSISPSGDGESSTSAIPGEQMTVMLDAQNDSGETGTAVLKDLNGKTQVSLRITGAPATAQPAHIHIGSCPTPGEVKYPLINLVNGESETTLDVSITELKKMLPLAVNVHKSAQEIKVYVACGDIK